MTLSITASHRMPESLRAFWRIVSFTAAKTSRTFDVSVACVKLPKMLISFRLPRSVALTVDIDSNVPG